MGKVTDFYTGYEGEPEIIFYFENSDGQQTQLKAWIGYFDSIMSAVQPAENGWKGLSYYYHTDTGWFEKTPWRIPDLEEVLKNIQNINITNLDKKTLSFYQNLCELFHQAKLINKEVWIEYY